MVSRNKTAQGCNSISEQNGNEVIMLPPKKGNQKTLKQILLPQGVKFLILMDPHTAAR